MSDRQSNLERADSSYWSSATSQRYNEKKPSEFSRPQRQRSSLNEQYEGSYAQVSNASPSVSSFSDQQPAQHALSSHPPPGKMLLPPLPRLQTVDAPPKPAEKNRTSHACNKCRKAKAKCSGGEPCDKCRNENKECVYGDGKRDKERKEMELLQVRNGELVNLLENLVQHHRLGVQWKREIVRLLEKSSDFQVEQDDDMKMLIDPKLNLGAPALTSAIEEGGLEMASTGSLGAIDEDVNRNEYTRAAGFIGKSSAVTWVMRAKKQTSGDVEDMKGSQMSYPGAAENTFASSCYHAEDTDFPAVETDTINPLDLPIMPVANALVETYFRHVHISFPIMSKSDFMDKFNRFLPKGQPEEISSEQQGWLCLLNLVFAIGAKFAHLTEAEHRGDDRDHMVYFLRAQNLGLDHRSLHKDSELQHTSCLGVLSLYLLVTDQTNRAWMISGLAIRHAMALGLHLRSKAKNLPDVDKEIRYRIWWSLYSLERLLDELTGRPSCISDRDISAPLPINLEEDQFQQHLPLYGREELRSGNLKRHQPSQSKGKAQNRPRFDPSVSGLTVSPKFGSRNPVIDSSLNLLPFASVQMPVTPSTFYIYRTQLNIISHEILSELYSTALVRARWSDVQETIHHIDAKLASWRESLPPEFNFGLHPSADVLGLQRIGLAMFYNSSRMTLFRPCLCRFDGRLSNESSQSKDFNAASVASCVQAARDVIEAFPSIEYPQSVYAITPWWNTIHYLIEAASVLMLELAYRAEHLPELAADILNDSKKAVMWLRAMAVESIAARKGWEIFDGLLRQVAPKVGGSATDMPDTAPIPPGWRGQRFGYQSQDPQNPGHVSHEAATSAWVHQSREDHSQYAMQQNFPVPGHSTVEISTGYLSALQPFNPSGQIYGRYDEFGPWHNSIYQGDGSTIIAEMGSDQLSAAAGSSSAMVSPEGRGAFPAYLDNAAAGGGDFGMYQNWTARRQSSSNRGKLKRKDSQK